MYKLTLITLLFFFITTSSHAYLGPGVGGSFIVATIGVIIAIFAAVVFGLIWFPLKRLLKKKKRKKRK